jgi:hypothetical protein
VIAAAGPVIIYHNSNGFFIGLLPYLFFLLIIISPAVFAIWTVVDAALTPNEAFQSAGSSKRFWITLIAASLVVTGPIAALPAAVYMLGVRRKLHPRPPPPRFPRTGIAEGECGVSASARFDPKRVRAARHRHPLGPRTPVFATSGKVAMLTRKHEVVGIWLLLAGPPPSGALLAVHRP